MDELHERLAMNIRRLAKARGVAVSHLPDFAEVSRAHYWYVMNGTRSPTLRWVGSVAKALDVDIVELLAPLDPSEAQAAQVKRR